MAFFRFIILSFLMAVVVLGTPIEHGIRRRRQDDIDYAQLDNDLNTNNCVHQCVHGKCRRSPESTECQCEKGWVGLSCNLPCNLNCQNGRCTVKRTKTVPSQITQEDMFCLCEVGYSLEDCTDKIPKTVEEVKDKYRSINIILGTCLSLVFVIGIGIPLFLWLRESYRPCSRTRRLTETLPSKSADLKSFDAFVSYSATGNAALFVKELLSHRLVSQGIKTFIPHQDQADPQGTEENVDIMSAFKRCRRHILVLSHDYLTNKEWRNMEGLYSDFQNKELQPEIVPILLDDIKPQDLQEMPENLKNELSSATCLKVPSCWEATSAMSISDNAKPPDSNAMDMMNLFWSRLEMALSKKEHNINQTTLNDQQ